MTTGVLGGGGSGKNRRRQTWGPALERIRLKLGWRQTKVIVRCFEILAARGVNPEEGYDFLTEDWLRRIERGQTIRPNREVVDLLCDALESTHNQRVRILSLAGFSILSDGAGSSDEAQLLNQAITLIYSIPEARELTTRLLKKHKMSAVELDEGEVLEIVHAVFTLAVRKRRERTAALEAGAHLDDPTLGTGQLAPPVSPVPSNAPPRADHHATTPDRSTPTTSSMPAMTDTSQASTQDGTHPTPDHRPDMQP